MQQNRTRLSITLNWVLFSQASRFVQLSVKDIPLLDGDFLILEITDTWQSQNSLRCYDS